MATKPSMTKSAAVLEMAIEATKQDTVTATKHDTVTATKQDTMNALSVLTKTSAPNLPTTISERAVPGSSN